MSKPRVVAIIPARMESSRFPGKPLARILDLPMVEHVRRRVFLSNAVDEVYVATCNQEIMDAVNEEGGKAIMTANTHERCTDRVEEAIHKVGGDIVLIVQGDEPLFNPDIVKLLIDPILNRPGVQCTNLISVIDKEEDLHDVDIVKAALDQAGRVMFFSRAPIPHLRVRKGCPMYRQTGLSAFTGSFLELFSKLTPTPMEIAESIDFLRILEHGHPIHGVVYQSETVGVDRPDDVGKVEKRLRVDPIQAALYRAITRR